MKLFNFVCCVAASIFVSASANAAILVEDFENPTTTYNNINVYNYYVKEYYHPLANVGVVYSSAYIFRGLFDSPENTAPASVVLYNMGMRARLVSFDVYNISDTAAVAGFDDGTATSFSVNPGFTRIVVDPKTRRFSPTISFGGRLYEYPTVFYDNIYYDNKFMPSVVPEPSSWIMLVCGFGIIGFALRGNRRDSRYC